jgi:mannose-6-phosphate isomerase-like protein (cupin superfamily)
LDMTTNIALTPATSTISDALASQATAAVSTAPVLVRDGGPAERIVALGTQLTFLHRIPGVVSVMHGVAPRDVGAPLHEHDFGEGYYILSGSIRFMFSVDDAVVLEAGDFVFVPGGTVHGFRAISELPAQFLNYQTSGDAGDFFRECARVVTKPEHMASVPEIGARHGVRLAAGAACVIRR